MFYKNMQIIAITKDRVDRIADLAAGFRVVLKSYKGISAKPDREAGRLELAEYIAAGFPVFAAVSDGVYAGYIVCRIDTPCVWVESLYVSPNYRRQGVASALHGKAEQLAKSYGEDTVYNYVHPNNHGMIRFLRSRGYTVINLVEIRKPYQGETLTQTIRVGEHTFDY